MTHKSAWHKKRWQRILIILLRWILIILLIASSVVSIITAPYWISCINLSFQLANEDLLSYFGAVLGFLSAILMGILAFWQNHKLHQINARILENEHRYSLVPQLDIQNVSVDYFNAFLPKDPPIFSQNSGIWEADVETFFLEDDECETSLVIELINVGEGLAKQITANYIDPEFKQDRESDILRFITKVNQKATLNYKLPLLMTEYDSADNHIIIEYSNIYDCRYCTSIDISYKYIDMYRFRVTVKQGYTVE
jgi:hypothetical protein